MPSSERTETRPWFFSVGHFIVFVVISLVIRVITHLIFNPSKPLIVAELLFNSIGWSFCMALYYSIVRRREWNARHRSQQES